MVRFILALLFFTISAAHGQHALWIKNAVANDFDDTDGKKMARHPDGSIYVLGQMLGTHSLEGTTLVSTNVDVFLAHYTADGALLWAKQLMEPASPELFYRNRATDIKIDSHGDLIMMGNNLWPVSFLGNPIGSGSYIAKLDKDANLKWMHYEPQVNNQDFDVSRRGHRIAIDKDDNIIWITNQIYRSSFDVSERGLGLIKYAPDGTKLWNKLITHDDEYEQPQITGISLDNNENIIVSGIFFTYIHIGTVNFFNNTSIYVNPHQLFLAKFSPEGNFNWAIQSNYGASTGSLSNVADADGNIYLVGVMGPGTRLGTSSYIYNNSDVGKGFIARIDPNGKVEWINLLENAAPYDIAKDKNGYLYITGNDYYPGFRYQSYRRPNTGFSQRAFVLKINQGGNFQSALYSMGPSGAVGWQSLVDPDGNIFTLGSFANHISFGCITSGITSYSFFLVKHDMVPPPLYNLSINGPPTMCEPATVTLQATITTGSQYHWYLPDGVTPISGSEITTDNFITVNITKVANDQHVVVAVEGDDCREIFSTPFAIHIFAPPAPPELILNPATICPGATSIEYAVKRDENTVAFVWTLPPGVTANLNAYSDTASLNFESAFAGGEVTVRATGYCIEPPAIQFSIDTYQKPGKPTITGLPVVCSNIPDQVWTIAPVEHALHYQWELPPSLIPNPLFPQDDVALHVQVFPQFVNGYVRVWAVGQCTDGEASDPFYVSTVGKPTGVPQLSGSPKICVGDGNTVATFQLTGIANATKYIWSIPQLFSPHGKITNTTNALQLNPVEASTGIIKVYAMNQCNQKSDSVTLNVQSLLNVQTPVIQKEKCDVALTIAENENIEWYKDGVLMTGISQTKIEVVDSGAYYVRVSNYCGEEQSAVTDAYPVVTDKLFVPNVITPNGDGKNDFFIIDKSLKNSSLSVFDRWGIQIYRHEHYANDWYADNLSTGTYYYTIRNNCLSQPYRGWLNIMD